MSGLGIIILTGGSSARLGTAKQALLYEGKSLLENTIEKAKQIEAHKRVVVTGAYGDTFNHQISSEFEIINNTNHSLGMSSSLKVGLDFLNDDYQIKSTLIMLVDQPLIPVSHYQNLASALSAHDEIVATKFGDLDASQFGAPTIFTRKYFGELLELSDQQGAKSIINKHIEKTKFVVCNEAAFDIDTPEDYELLKDSEKKHLEP